MCFSAHTFVVPYTKLCRTENFPRYMSSCYRIWLKNISLILFLGVFLLGQIVEFGSNHSFGYFLIKLYVHIGAISWDLKVLFGNNCVLTFFTCLQDNISHRRSLPHRRIGEECKAHQVLRLLYEAWLGILRHPSHGSLCSCCCNDDHQPLGVPCVLLELLKSCNGWVHEAPKWGWCGHDRLRPWQGCFWAMSEMESYWRLPTRVAPAV